MLSLLLLLLSFCFFLNERRDFIKNRQRGEERKTVRGLDAKKASKAHSKQPMEKKAGHVPQLKTQRWK